MKLSLYYVIILFAALISLTPAYAVKVGILHSLTGALAMSEKPVVDAVKLAVEEINNAGGVLGEFIEPMVYDGASDPDTFAQGARYLIDQGVSAIFGCWSSATRKRVKPIIENNNHILFYPVQYEGVEQSPHIVYTGCAPNQQTIPAVTWLMENLGKRVYLIGSDYIFPHVANEMAKDVIRMYHGEVVGEQYVLLGSKNVDTVIEDIIAKNRTLF